MEIFICTFLIKLQYVKKSKESSLKLSNTTTFDVVLKSSKNHIIASGASKPKLMNDTAWFNQKFEINSDLLYNPQTKTYNQSMITLEINSLSKYSNASYKKSFNLAQIVEKKMISEREYILSGGLVAGIQLCCSQIYSKGIKPLRNTDKSLEKIEKIQDYSNSFLILQKISFSQQNERDNFNDTPEFHDKLSFKQIQQSQYLTPTIPQYRDPQLHGLKQQFNKQQQEHEQTKSKLKLAKSFLQSEYNLNRQHKETISRLERQIKQQKQCNSSLQNHLSQNENLCTALSATLTHKETDIIELQTVVDDFKERVARLTKNNQTIDSLEQSKARLERQIEKLKKQIENSKNSLYKQQLSQKQIKNQCQVLKTQNLKLKNIKDKVDQQLTKALKKQKQNAALIIKLTQQKDQIKLETTKWRSQFAIQAHIKDQQINQLQQHFNQLFNRYSQMQNKQSSADTMIKKDVLNKIIKDYQRKIDQYEEKQSKLRQQLEIIQEEISNLQSLLEQKEENEEILLEHIKKLQKDIDSYAITHNWWNSVLEKQKSTIQNHAIEQSDQKTKLMNKNKHLIQLLQKNSFTILEGEKLKLQLLNLKKQHEQLIQKELVYNQQQIEIKQKIANLYKENKKLQDKNYKLLKDNQQLNKKNIWLQEEITHSKNTEKQAKQDYQIISFQLYNFHTKRQKKESQLKEKASNYLSVINQNSEEFLTNSHQLIKQSFIKDQIKQDYEAHFDKIVLQELVKTLEQRVNYTQQMYQYFQKDNHQPNLSNSILDLKKQIKKLSISTSKIKTILIKSGNKDYAKQWQSAIASVEKNLQQFVICN